MAEITPAQAEKIKAGLREVIDRFPGDSIRERDALTLIEQLESERNAYAAKLDILAIQASKKAEHGAALSPTAQQGPGDDLTPYLTAAVEWTKWQFNLVFSRGEKMGTPWAEAVINNARALLAAHRAGGGK